MVVVFHHCAATCHVDDHCIELIALEGLDILLHQVKRWLRGTAVIMNGTTARLAAWDHDIAAVFLQHTGRGPVNVSKHGISHATEKQSHASPADSLCREECGKLRK